MQKCETKFEIPILLLVFNRLDTTKKVFETICNIKPTKLYIASDGPRDTVLGEEEVVGNVRKYLLENIDWECETQLLFRDSNLGCGLACSSAIDWFFEHEEMGIILEDDTVPNQSFFRFCEELLREYEKEPKVMHIAGYNHFPSLTKTREESFSFSKKASIWGWATWRRAWKNYDYKMENFSQIEQTQKLIDMYPIEKEREQKIKEFKLLKERNFYTWDFQWEFAVRYNDGIAIRPTCNMVYNIGFGEDATHTTTVNRRIINNRAVDLTHLIKKPNELTIDYQLDCKVYELHRKERIRMRLMHFFTLDFSKKIINAISKRIVNARK